MKKILYPIIILLLATSCGNLIRGKAKEEIIKNQQLPQSENAELPKKYRIFDELTQYLNVPGFEYYSVYETKLKALESMGYIILKEEQYMYDAGGIVGSWLIKYMNVELTDKGKKDLISDNENGYTIKFCDLDFGEVTGMVENKAFNLTEVNYTTVRTNVSEFGKGVKELKGGSITTMSFNHVARFSKYDDGWRISK